MFVHVLCKSCVKGPGAFAYIGAKQLVHSHGLSNLSIQCHVGRQTKVATGYLPRAFERGTPCGSIGFATTYLRGNHEDFLLRFLDDTSDGASWLYYGGTNTPISYGIPASPLETDPGRLIALQQKLFDVLPEPHLAFLRGLEISHVVGDYFFVHAGIRPGIPLAEQSNDDLIWIREPFLESTQDHGCVIVHGHSVRVRPEMLANRIGIDTGAYDTGVLTCLVLQGRGQWLLQT